MKCVNCGMELSDNMKFCIGCGAPVQQMKPVYREETKEKEERVCPNCGALLIQGYKFCTSCGSRLPQETGETLSKPEDMASDADVFQEPESEERALPEAEEQETYAIEENGASEALSAEGFPEGSDIDDEEEITEEERMPQGEVAEEDDETVTSEISVIVLTDLEDPQRQYKAPIEGEILIGRRRADIVIPDDMEISRSHCRIILREDALYLVDAASKNGTFYQDCRIAANQEIPIGNGDVIRIGRHKLKVERIVE